MPSEPLWTASSRPSSPELRRAGWFTVLLLLITVVGDGWSGRPFGLRHQLILLPITALFLLGAWKLLFGDEKAGGAAIWTECRALWLLFIFEAAFALLFLYEAHHFAAFGYTLHRAAALLVFGALLLAFAALALARNIKARWVFGLSVAAYAAGLLLAVASFPLNYLRSDMLPVILWSDTHLLHGISPYQTIPVGDRLYDFPYLPGMLLTYLPFIAAHLDVRLGSLAYLIATAGLVYWAARRERRLQVAALFALFLLCPFLQYRHDLYLQPHWFTLAAIYVLKQRRRFAWAAFAFGISMAVYQFSWILFPFFLLNALRRRGWLEVAKLALISAAGALLVLGPFLSSALQRISHNTVGQWALLPHAVADPINLSFWVTYLVRPDKLLRVQAVLMVTIFAVCFVRRRCATLEDTLRWSCAALTVFILFNSIVDGYFYLMLLVPLLLYTCVANGWFRDPAAESGPPRLEITALEA